MKDITPILCSLGLLESEIKTYMAALKNGASTVLDISKKTKLSRQATYVAIDGLVQRGLMSSSLQGKKRFYAAEHPDKLLAYAKRKKLELEDRVADLERMVPQLELRMGGDKPVVRVYEGKEGIKAIIEDIGTTDFEKFWEITDVDAMYQVITADDLKGLRGRLKQQVSSAEGLYSGSLLEKTHSNSKRYILPNHESGFNSHIAIHGDKIQMVTFEGKMFSVIVESASLSAALKILFEYALKQAEAQDLPEQ